MKTAFSSADCSCSESLVIPRRWALRIMGTLIMGGSTLFVAGYFWGCHKGAEVFCTQAEQTAFTDAIDYSLTKHFGRDEAQEEAYGAALIAENKEEEAPKSNHVEEMLSQATLLAEQNAAAGESSSILLHKQLVSSAPQTYQALVLGGTKALVENFIKVMAQEGIMLELRERSSTSQKGKKYIWYQAVTPLHTDKKELENKVALLKKRGKLNDVRIVQVG